MLVLFYFLFLLGKSRHLGKFLQIVSRERDTHTGPVERRVLFTSKLNSFRASIWLQESASLEPRTSSAKFARSSCTDHSGFYQPGYPLLPPPTLLLNMQLPVVKTRSSQYVNASLYAMTLELNFQIKNTLSEVNIGDGGVLCHGNISRFCATAGLKDAFLTSLLATPLCHTQTKFIG